MKNFNLNKNISLALILFILIISVAIFSGCSGESGSGGSSPINIIYTDNKAIGSTGGTFDSPQHNVNINITPNTFYQQANVSVEVLESQHFDIQKNGFHYSPNGVNLTIEPSSMDGIGKTAASPSLSSNAGAAESGAKEIRVKIPYKGSYSEAHPPLFIAMNQNGFFVPVDYETDTASAAIIGLIDTMEVSALMDGVSGKLKLKMFVANLKADQDASGAIIASVKLFNRTGNKFDTSTLPSLSGKKVAVVVHGITSNLTESQPLGAFLATFRKNGSLYYDYVIGFEYSSNARISELGAKMAAMVYPLVSNSSQVDIFAHSMGNLVARYAMTTQNVEKVPNRLGMIKHYVALGGPHEGVPLVTISGFKFFDLMAYIFGVETINCAYDLLTYVDQLEPYTTFLRDLNDFSKNNGVGPEYKTLRVYSLAGQNYENYKMLVVVPVGKIFNYMYKSAIENSKKTLVYKIDGIVADYSASSTSQKTLDKLSEYHKNTQAASVIFPELNHGELMKDIKALNQISDWLNNYWE